MSVSFITRFAPSPNGYLHLGHALSALTAFETARRENGRFLLRIEDIDFERCRPEYEAAIYEDLAWLGLAWEQPVRRQSDHMADYAAALDCLKQKRVAYPCFCSRKDIAEAIHATGFDQRGPDGPQYPGTCRGLTSEEVAARLSQGEVPGWRLDAARAASLTGPLTWHDRDAGTVPVLPGRFGDVLVARRDNPTSYHLSVTVDDHIQGITLVVRGLDLFDATDIHRTLQALLGYEPPEYFHHKLLLDPATGAKTLKARPLDRAEGLAASGTDGGRNQATGRTAI